MLVTFASIWLYGQDVDSLLSILDNKIVNKELYEKVKEKKLSELKTARNLLSKIPSEVYQINKALYEEYNNYMSDSAIFYLNQNLELADSLKDEPKLNDVYISSASLFIRLGMYLEASQYLKKVKNAILSLRQNADFYITYMNLYLGLGSYSQNTKEKHGYWILAKSYSDSMMRIVPPQSEEYLRNIEKEYRLKKEFSAALAANDKRLALTKPYTTQYALVTFHRSLIYRGIKDLNNEKRFLALSAISDAELSVKDNASISILAAILMHEGDINRAYQYIRFSLDNIKDYNTRIRSSEVLNIQRIIDKEYQNRNEKRRKELQLVLIVVCILSLLLAISVIYVYKQMKKGLTFSRKLKEINSELEALNTKLNDTNNALTNRNLEVAQANHIQEEYIAYFLDECAKYIVKLDNYRIMVNAKIRGKQYESLYNVTRDNSLKIKESKELFLNFDNMFIKLFPDFIQRINTLLADEDQVSIRKGEGLNTELRIYALIRLGITDSATIARILGYSVNTIYNYRTKMKNKAKVAREDFEDAVKKIGTII